ncbi:hypothetical protein F4054_23935 [Candidatus Poribacteria bacterium]|nr:hypothetical protein [Candidatus Poribacteria bacterium]
MSNKNGARDQFLEKVTMYKGFIVKYLAFMFHDDIFPKEMGGKHYHNLELIVGIFLGILLVINFVKIVLSSITEIRTLWKTLWNCR